MWMMMSEGVSRMVGVGVWAWAELPRPTAVARRGRSSNKWPFLSSCDF